VLFQDQISAGRKLAVKLKSYQGKNGVILAIPRGGVATGFGLSQKLRLPLDVIVTRKIGAPDNPELAVGATGETKDSLWLNKRLIKELGIDRNYLYSEVKIQKLEIKRRERIYRQGKKPLDLKDKIVILVDDGVATGATMVSAIREARAMKARKVVAATPVASVEAAERLKKEADEFICLQTPALFFSVGQWYQNFRQYSDQEVIKFLKNGSSS